MAHPTRQNSKSKAYKGAVQKSHVENEFKFLCIDNTIQPKKLFGEIQTTLSDIHVSLMPRHQRQCKDVPICSIAYEGAQTLDIHPKWMWDAVSGGLSHYQGDEY